MNIRNAEEKDLNDIINLFYQLDKFHRDNVPNTFKIITEEYRTKTFMEYLKNNDNFFMVAEIDGSIVGFIDASVKEIVDDEMLIDKKFMRIENLVVDECHRRKHIGEELMRYIEKIARSMNLDFVELGVHEFNDAKHLYENMGFCTTIRKMRKELR